MTSQSCDLVDRIHSDVSSSCTNTMAFLWACDLLRTSPTCLLGDESVLLTLTHFWPTTVSSSPATNARSSCSLLIFVFMCSSLVLCVFYLGYWVFLSQIWANHSCSQALLHIFKRFWAILGCFQPNLKHYPAFFNCQLTLLLSTSPF